jgi:hypothetical protein
MDGYFVADHRLQFLLLLPVEFFLKTAFLSGARPALLMGVDPDTSGKKAISGAPIWTMCGAYGMRHHCHAASNNLSVAHLNMRYA